MPILLLDVDSTLPVTLRTIPLPPLEQSHTRIQHGDNPARDQAHADGTIGVAVEGLAGVIRIAFDPDMIKGNDLRRSRTGFARDDLIAGKGNDSFDGYMRRVCRRSKSRTNSSKKTEKERKKKLQISLHVSLTPNTFIFQKLVRSPKRHHHASFQPSFLSPWPTRPPRPHVDQHHVAPGVHLRIILVQVRRHRRTPHPHHLEDMIGEKQRNGDNGRQVPKDSCRASNRRREGGGVS